MFFYSVFWLIIYLAGGAPNFAFSSPVFWSLIVALLADIVVHGVPYIRK